MPELNYPGPYEVRIFYTVGGLTHSQRLSCDVAVDDEPGLPFSSYDVHRVGDTPLALDAAIDAYITLIKPFFQNTVTFTHAELWRYEPLTFNADFYSTYTINVVGTHASAAYNGGQLILTFRTLGGGVLKLNYMETSYQMGLPTGLSGAPAAVQALVNFVLSTGNWIIARDTTYPFAFMRQFPGQNEAVARKRWRPS